MRAEPPPLLPQRVHAVVLGAEVVAGDLEPPFERAFLGVEGVEVSVHAAGFTRPVFASTAWTAAAPASTNTLSRYTAGDEATAPAASSFHFRLPLFASSA